MTEACRDGRSAIAVCEAMESSKGRGWGWDALCISDLSLPSKRSNTERLKPTNVDDQVLQSRTSWVSLAQSLSGGCSRALGWGSGHPKPPLELKDPLLSPFMRPLAEAPCPRTPWGPPHTLPGVLMTCKLVMCVSVYGEMAGVGGGEDTQNRNQSLCNLIFNGPINASCVVCVRIWISGSPRTQGQGTAPGSLSQASLGAT